MTCPSDGALSDRARSHGDVPGTPLDRARAEYVRQLHQDKPVLEEQIKDLARLFGTLIGADALARASAQARRLMPSIDRPSASQEG